VINYIERKRKLLSLLFAVFMVVLVIFISLFGNKLNNLDSQINEVEKFREQGIQQYVDLNKERNIIILSAIREDWNVYVRNYTLNENHSEYIDNFVNRYIRSVQNTSNLFVIAVSRRGNILYEEFNDERYNYLNLTDLTLKKNDSTIKKTVDGETKVFHYNLTELEHRDLNFTVYVGFLEEVIQDRFIDPIDLKTLKSMQNQIEWVITFLTLLMISLGTLGVAILYQIIQLGRNFREDERAKYGAMMLLEDYVDSKDPEVRELIEAKIENKSHKVSLLKLLRDIGTKYRTF